MIRSIRIIQGRSASLRTVSGSSGSLLTSSDSNHYPTQLKLSPLLPSSSPSSSTSASMFPVRRHLHHLATGAAAVTTSHLSKSSLHKDYKQHNQQQLRTVFIQTENTPNPESIKFVPTNMVRFSRRCLCY